MSFAFPRAKTDEVCPAALMSVSEFVTVRTSPPPSTRQNRVRGFLLLGEENINKSLIIDEAFIMLLMSGSCPYFELRTAVFIELRELDFEHTVLFLSFCFIDSHFFW